MLCIYGLYLYKKNLNLFVHVISIIVVNSKSLSNGSNLFLITDAIVISKLHQKCSNNFVITITDVHIKSTSNILNLFVITTCITILSLNVYKKLEHVCNYCYKYK